MPERCINKGMRGLCSQTPDNYVLAVATFDRRRVNNPDNWTTGCKKKSGRGPPTSPALGLRVLTPRNQCAHREAGAGAYYPTAGGKSIERRETAVD